jgi:hypothetical protein
VHRPVRRKHLANEADHALHSSAAFETGDEETPDTLALPSIGDGDGELGDPRLRHHVAAFPDRHFLAFDEDRCEKREVVMVVDAREAVEQGSRQLVQGSEEAVSPRFGGEAAEKSCMSSASCGKTGRSMMRSPPAPRTISINSAG